MRGHWKKLCPSSGIPSDVERHTGRPTTHSLGLAGKLNDRGILATRRISGHSSGQQLRYSYARGFVVIYLQLSISCLSSPECLITVHGQ